MILVRSLLFQVYLIGSTIYYSSAILILDALLRHPPTDRLGRAWGYSNLWALRKLCGLDYRVSGLDHLPREPAIVLSKHQSAWETIALRAILPLNQSWVLKEELIRIPLFGGALKRFKSIAIRRSEGRKGMIKLIREGQQVLDEGRWVMVFPEGTRVAPGTRQRYEIGGALLAERCKRDVIPVAHNAGEFWGRRSFLKYPGTIDVVVGPVIPTQGRKATEINAEVEEWIESQVAALPDRFGQVAAARQ
ncbi:lysophospholipid acyltransferase family protein [Imhoffiella purpurea]|uniref:1-acyl-sn-glycerol-3-phosphate acyltransferase n=1 Tax=Imhoffiella purpurea TaxID=1249627 RepID=W9W3J4_9GAMM|nr:lysophospholipid acyltransferase family protein [Imhoffiella purpurea]EXJ17135.1 1-acyl-sn-glycerol-3-phosphate acyltransferase [Imhoffiella purpurea]